MLHSCWSLNFVAEFVSCLLYIRRRVSASRTRRSSMQVCSVNKAFQACRNAQSVLNALLQRSGGAQMTLTFVYSVILFHPGRQRQPPQSPVAGRWQSPCCLLSLSATFSDIHFSFDDSQYLLFFCAQLERQAFACRTPDCTRS